QCFRPVGMHQLFGGLFYARRHAAFQSHTELFTLSLKPVNKSLPGDDGRRRDCDVRFCSRPLFDDNVAPVAQQRFLDTRVSANWSDNDRGQPGFRSSKFSITRAWPQPSRRFKLLNFSYSSLYLAGPIRTVSTNPCELFRIVSASVRIRASELIRLLSTTPASRSLRAIPRSA